MLVRSRRVVTRSAALAIALQIVAWMAPPPSAVAQRAPADTKASKIDCNSPSSTPEITYCAGVDLKAAEVELVQVMKAVIGAIDKADNLKTPQRNDWKRAMREAQRHWLAYRKQDCGAVTGWEWFQGTGASAASLGCEATKVRARIAELKQRYQLK